MALPTRQPQSPQTTILSMMLQRLSQAAIVLFLLIPQKSSAYPTGAGGCAGGGSVGGPHLNSTSIVTGSLNDFGAVIYFGAVDKLVVGQVTNFTIDEEHTMVITSDKTFRGLLFRLTSDGDANFDPRGALTVSPDLPVLEQISQVCFDEGIAGVTHLNNTDKTITEAVLKTNQVVEGLTLEITLVVSNRIMDNGTFVSEYYWSSYQLNSFDPDETASPTDFQFPTFAPSMSLSPSTIPVMATGPTLQPTRNQAATFPPTLAPVVPTTASPTVTARPTSVDDRSEAPAAAANSLSSGCMTRVSMSMMVATAIAAFGLVLL
ncbi:hypothetical protein MPSEU_000975900 [Mayamaea pseudoterrestris]|nr:hypothetical protein MPSEU_000975900 [Mayamaea pseudoterrestris]